MPPVRFDRFQRVRERDRWGLGECVDALDTWHRDAPVVLKRLPPLAAEQHGRVEAAARSLEPLRHNTIVPVEGYGFDGDVPFLVVEPVEGTSLRAWIDEHNTALRWPDLAEVRALFDGVCAAVAVAHRMRALAGAPVLHGLLSPESVLLSRGHGSGAWDVCVMDFALSTLPGVVWSPAPASLMSDPRAPEQLSDPEAVSTASDVFSLGVLLASMLVPFAFPVRPRCWAHSVEEQPAAGRALLAAMRPDLPGALGDELGKALALDPRGRHADADRLRTALRRVSWEAVAELGPPPRLVEPAEPRERERDDGHSKPMLRLPAALLADLGPSPMNLRASVPTQKMFNAGLARPELAAPSPVAHAAARSFETASAPTTVDALLALRRLPRDGGFAGTAEALAPPERHLPDEPVDEPTGSITLPPTADATEHFQLPDDDLFAARADPPPAESTRALQLSPAMFDARPAEGMLVAGVRLQSLVLKAPPRPSQHHDGTRVGLAMPAAEAPGGPPGDGSADAPARESLPGETPADPWAAGEPSPAFPPPPLPTALPTWSVQARLPTMPPPRPWVDLSHAPAAPPASWAEPPPAPGLAAPSPVPPSSSLRGLLLAIALVGVLAFALGVLAGR